jgi:hypothetical protein
MPLHRKRLQDKGKFPNTKSKFPRNRLKLDRTIHFDLSPVLILNIFFDHLTLFLTFVLYRFLLTALLPPLFVRANSCITTCTPMKHPNYSDIHWQQANHCYTKTSQNTSFFSWPFHARPGNTLFNKCRCCYVVFSGRPLLVFHRKMNTFQHTTVWLRPSDLMEIAKL